MVRKCKVCIGVVSFDGGTESSIWMGVWVNVMPVMCLEQSTDDTIEVVECCGGWIRVADHGEVLVVDAMVGRAHQASDGVVDDGYVGGVYLGDTNVCTDVDAQAPFAMRSAVGERGLEHVDGQPKTW